MFDVTGIYKKKAERMKKVFYRLTSGKGRGYFRNHDINTCLDLLCARHCSRTCTAYFKKVKPRRKEGREKAFV